MPMQIIIVNHFSHECCFYCRSEFRLVLGLQWSFEWSHSSEIKRLTFSSTWLSGSTSNKWYPQVSNSPFYMIRLSTPGFIMTYKIHDWFWDLQSSRRYISNSYLGTFESQCTKWQDSTLLISKWEDTNPLYSLIVLWSSSVCLAEIPRSYLQWILHSAWTWMTSRNFRHAFRKFSTMREHSDSLSVWSFKSMIFAAWPRHSTVEMEDIPHWGPCLSNPLSEGSILLYQSNVLFCF